MTTHHRVIPSTLLLLAGLAGCDPSGASSKIDVDELIASLDEILDDGTVDAKGIVPRDEDGRSIIVETYLDPEPEEPFTCSIDILGPNRAVLGRPTEITWSTDELDSSEIYVAVFSGWNPADYALTTVVPNTGSFEWSVPDDLDSDLEYHIYVESIEEEEGIPLCWNYLPLQILEPAERIDREEVMEQILQMAELESCAIEGIISGRYLDYEDTSGGTFRGLGFSNDGNRGRLAGHYASAPEDDGSRFRGRYEGRDGALGVLRGRTDPIGSSPSGEFGTFHGRWSQAQEAASGERRDHGTLAGVWHPLTDTGGGFFAGFWSHCKDSASRSTDTP